MQHPRAPFVRPVAEKGQTSAEFLITVSGVFLALLGVSMVFDGQAGEYLRLLMKLLRVPF